jgi:hypothetical protein
VNWRRREDLDLVWSFCSRAGLAVLDSLAFWLALASLSAGGRARLFLDCSNVRDEMALHAKLTEMVIGVEVRPSQPRRLRHSAEDGMEVAGQVAAPIGRDLSEEPFKLRDVRLEGRRPGATSVLIEIGSGRNAGRPSHGSVQSDPSDHESWNRRRGEFGRPVSGQQTVSVAQVAHHLMG